MENLLIAPERSVIEKFLKRISDQEEENASYEKLLGYLSGSAITPGRFMPSDWLQPLLKKYDLIFDDMKEANDFVGALMSLYNRVNAAQLRDENLCPYNPADAAQSE
jgi:yecA family protein